MLYGIRMNARFIFVLLALSSCTASWSKVGTFHPSRMNGLAYSAELNANTANQSLDGITATHRDMSAQVELMRAKVTEAESKAAALGARPVRTEPVKKSKAVKKQKPEGIAAPVEKPAEEKKSS